MTTLSVLETSPAPGGVSGYEAVADTVRVARAADDLGYHRLWLTEHHSSPIASSAPAVLLAHVAAHTQRIRVGSGGVMLTNYSPLVIAEQFSTLEALHPGRIDLGVGSSSGAPTSYPYEYALRRTRQPGARFPAQLDELLGFLGRGFPADHPCHGVALSPVVDAVPVLVLGSGENGATQAGERGLPFAFGHHLGRSAPAPVLARYREAFRAAAPHGRPRVTVSIRVICAPTDEEAQQAAMAYAVTAVRAAAVAAGQRAESPAAEGAVTPREGYLARKALTSAPTLIGGPDSVAADLAALAAACKADELLLVVVEQAATDRIRTLALIAAACARAGDGVALVRVA